MKNSLLKWFVAVGVVLAVLMAGNAWADGHGRGHQRGGHHMAPPHHGGHGYHHAPRVVHQGPYYVHPPVRHYVHHYYAPPVVQHHTYYVPAPAPVYVAPPPPPGFAFSATINEPGFSLGFAAGN
mgnify:CR=1 FL=1